MKKQSLAILVLFAVSTLATFANDQGRSASADENVSLAVTTAAPHFDGKYCAGSGDVAWLKLIDKSFAFFHANPDVPNMTMLYQPDWDTLCEGANWPGWFTQNSYGFSYAATPFLQEPWFSLLQRSWDLMWNNQGDGKRIGFFDGSATSSPLSALVGPDGCLGDGVCNDIRGIAYKQGDGPEKIHDWIYEATAAIVIMQAEILLTSRDAKAIVYYLPKLERACNFVERTRNSQNNLLLVGPGCNLLGPSYGGVRQPNGAFGKGYLAGLSITYTAALGRMVELYKLTGDKEKLAEYEHRQKISRESLAQLLTPGGYFVKSIEPGGIKHGVLGQKKFGYLEGVANADAMGLRVADDATAHSIYRAIKNYPAIRPFDFLLTNAPGLDDTYWAWGTAKPIRHNFFDFGDWVNGGCWATVEGRAILGYYRVGAFADVRRSAERAMKWAIEFRTDAPWSQRGENTHNSWSDSGQYQVGGVAVMIDNFAIPAATIRGLFDYDYRFDRLILRPRVPGAIAEYIQKEPIRFGGKTLYISCRNGGMKIKSVAINGRPLTVESPDAADLRYDDLPTKARVNIVTEGGWDAELAQATAPPIPAAATVAAVPQTELPDSLKKPYAALKALDKLLAGEPNVAESEWTFVRNAIRATEVWRERTAIEAQGFFRPMTTQKRDAIVKFYENAALRMYQGFAKRMSGYAKSSDPGKKRLAELFRQVTQ
jgi:hypothetical protein